MIPQLPQECEITGQLIAPTDPALLNSDMLEVYCPSGGILIRAGWYPEHDPAGEYVISVYSDCNQIEVERARSISRAVRTVVELANKYARTYYELSANPRHRECDLLYEHSAIYGRLPRCNEVMPRP